MTKSFPKRFGALHAYVSIFLYQKGRRLNLFPYYKGQLSMEATCKTCLRKIFISLSSRPLNYRVRLNI